MNSECMRVFMAVPLSSCLSRRTELLHLCEWAWEKWVSNCFFMFAQTNMNILRSLSLCENLICFVFCCIGHAVVVAKASEKAATHDLMICLPSLWLLFDLISLSTFENFTVDNNNDRQKRQLVCMPPPQNELNACRHFIHPKCRKFRLILNFKYDDHLFCHKTVS